MKKHLVYALAILLCSFTLKGFSRSLDIGTAVNKKVLSVFNKTFPDAHDVVWQEVPGKYIAEFKQSGIQNVVYYDVDGNLQQAIRYYYAENLPTSIISKLKRKFPDQSIYGVTEVSSNDNINYYVKMQDDKNWTTVLIDPSGSLEVVDKYQKQQ